MADLTREFPCYTGTDKGCWAWPYEELLDRLAASIGDGPARVAFRVIGTNLTATATTRMLDPLMHAYGDGLLKVAGETIPDGSHSRQDFPPAT